MLLYLTEYLARFYSGFHVFQYLTLRGILAAMTALLMALFIGPLMISLLSRYQIGQVVRSDGPQTHLQKTGTPTMGGGLILVAMGIGTLLWADLSSRFVWVLLGTTLAFGVDRLLRRLFEAGGRATPRAWPRATSIWRSRLRGSRSPWRCTACINRRPRPRCTCRSSRPWPCRCRRSASSRSPTSSSSAAAMR